MQYTLTVDQEVQKKLDDQLAGAEQTEKGGRVVYLQAERAQAFSKTVKQQEAWARNPATFKMLKTAMETERAQEDWE